MAREPAAASPRLGSGGRKRDAWGQGCEVPKFGLRIGRLAICFGSKVVPVGDLFGLDRAWRWSLQTVSVTAPDFQLHVKTHDLIDEDADSLDLDFRSRGRP